MNTMEIIRLLNKMIDNTKYTIRKNDVNILRKRVRYTYLIDK